MIDIVLFSRSGDDVTLAEMSKRVAGPERRLIVFYSNSAVGNHLVSSVDHADVKFVHAKVVSWGPAILSSLGTFFDRSSGLYLIDVDFLLTFSVDPDPFLSMDSPASFLAFDGRFDQTENGEWKYIFPTWDLCRISSDLLQDDAFRNFVKFVDPVQDADGRYYAERYFFTHFRNLFKFECLFESRSAQSFHPLANNLVDR